MRECCVFCVQRTKCYGHRVPSYSFRDAFSTAHDAKCLKLCAPTRNVRWDCADADSTILEFIRLHANRALMRLARDRSPGAVFVSVTWKNPNAQRVTHLTHEWRDITFLSSTVVAAMETMSHSVLIFRRRVRATTPIQFSGTCSLVEYFNFLLLQTSTRWRTLSTAIHLITHWWQSVELKWRLEVITVQGDQHSTYLYSIACIQCIHKMTFKIIIKSYRSFRPVYNMISLFSLKYERWYSNAETELPFFWFQVTICPSVDDLRPSPT